MDLSIRTETFANEDQSWLGSAHGTSAARSVTLDHSAFTEGTHYPDGYFPSGIALALVDGKAVPYVSGGGSGTGVLAGFLFTTIKATGNDVVGALLDHGRVLVGNLPVAGFTAPTAANDKTTIVFVAAEGS